MVFRMTKKPAGNKTKVPLEDRKDLLNTWFIKSWFNKNEIEEKYLKKIFLVLFMSLYDDLSEKFNSKRRR